MNLAHLPLRAAIGAYVLNSGLNKRNLEAEAAEGMHAMAANAIPELERLDPQEFGRRLSNAEVALGVALLVPFVPSALAGLALTAFGAGLVRLYLNTPGMREPGSIRPTEAGIGLAKDVWLLGAGLTLVLDSLRPRR
jgi:hypothetical protein